MGINQSGVE